MLLRILIFVLVVVAAPVATAPASATDKSPNLSDDKALRDRSEIPKLIESSFTPPPELADEFGAYKSLLTFRDGTPVKTAADWQKRRKEILAEWRSLTGSWPEPIEKPKIQYSEKTRRDNITQHRIYLGNRR